MRLAFFSALAASALSLVASQHIDLAYKLKIDTATENLGPIYKALNESPRWTDKQLSLALPGSTPANGQYKDANIQATWFGVNVPASWVADAPKDKLFWGGLNTPEKWAPGESYHVHGGSYEVIPQTESFTDSSADLDYYLMINRPSEPKMMRYRINFGDNGLKWYWFGTGTQYWKGAEMTGQIDVQGGHSYPTVQDGDTLAFVVRVPDSKMQEYAGQDIKSAFLIGGSVVEQVMHIDGEMSV
jgi:hypothetical protein